MAKKHITQFPPIDSIEKWNTFNIIRELKQKAIQPAVEIEVSPEREKFRADTLEVLNFLYPGIKVPQ